MSLFYFIAEPGAWKDTHIMRAKKQKVSIKCYNCEVNKPIPTVSLILCFFNYWIFDTGISLTKGKRKRRGGLGHLTLDCECLWWPSIFGEALCTEKYEEMSCFGRTISSYSSFNFVVYPCRVQGVFSGMIFFLFGRLQFLLRQHLLLLHCLTQGNSSNSSPPQVVCTQYCKTRKKN